jgi:P27 family predicted phage terminase small subunit
MRGKLPTPRDLRVLRGNPGRRPIPPESPRYAGLALEPEDPPELRGNVAAIAEYRRLGPRLAATGHVTECDRAAFLAYCYAWGQFVEATAAASGQPLTITTVRGAVQVNRVHERVDRTFKVFLRIAVDLGLTPSSRSRVTSRPAGPGRSKWDGVLR